jgi:uncharacterized protein YjiS (DUF1127 family)
MANFYVPAGVSESAQGSLPLSLSTKVTRAALLVARSTPSLISRVMGTLRTLRQRERDREELARMSRYELHDIRVSSSDRRAEISKPFWRK